MASLRLALKASMEEAKSLATPKIPSRPEKDSAKLHKSSVKLARKNSRLSDTQSVASDDSGRTSIRSGYSKLKNGEGKSLSHESSKSYLSFRDRGGHTCEGHCRCIIEEKKL